MFVKFGQASRANQYLYPKIIGRILNSPAAKKGVFRVFWKELYIRSQIHVLHNEQYVRLTREALYLEWLDSQADRLAVSPTYFGKSFTLNSENPVQEVCNHVITFLTS